MKIHGAIFMNKLFFILQEHGENYDKKFKPDRSKLEKDIRFLFDINKEDKKIYPQNVFRAYTGTDTVLNTRIATTKPNETFLYDGILSQKTKMFLPTKLDMKSSFNSQYTLTDFKYKNKDQFFSLVNPFGIFQFDDKQRDFQMKYRFTKKLESLSDILKFIHNQPSKTTPIVLMIHCKEPDKKLLMDFDFTENPIEKFHKKSLVQMMELLTIKEKTPTPTRKTPTPVTRKSPVKRKRKLVIEKKTTKPVTGKLEQQIVPMEISP